MTKKREYRMSPADLLEACREIAEEYAEQGLKLTVRQLYYQVVARGLETNGQHIYRRVVETLSTARLSGRFSMDLLEDRGRSAGQSSTEVLLDVDRADREVMQFISEAPEVMLGAGRWIGQRSLPFVWVEKEALAGVFEQPCQDLGIGLFPCKGYPSLQALWAWLTGIDEVIHGLECSSDYDALLRDINVSPDDVWESIVVLYFGDHDPDGIEIPESAARNLEELRDAHSAHLGYLPEIEFVRIALTQEQISRHRPPPFPAKETSSRFDSYVERTGLRDAWELDALDPTTLRSLIASEARPYFDNQIHDRVREVVLAKRKQLRDLIAADGWLTKALGRGAS